jgi:hypothetical protein
MGISDVSVCMGKWKEEGISLPEGKSITLLGLFILTANHKSQKQSKSQLRISSLEHRCVPGRKIVKPCSTSVFTWTSSDSSSAISFRLSRPTPRSQILAIISIRHLTRFHSSFKGISTQITENHPQSSLSSFRALSPTSLWPAPLLHQPRIGLRYQSPHPKHVPRVTYTTTSLVPGNSHTQPRVGPISHSS